MDNFYLKVLPMVRITKPAVRKLLKWKQGDDHSEWVEKAVVYLVRKLKYDMGALNKFLDALSNRNEVSKCVSIPRNKDGRVLVNSERNYAHVIYCRVFRWPGLKSRHELESIETCEFPFHDSTKAEVCVNPYHYRRSLEKKSKIPAVRVPRQVAPASLKIEMCRGESIVRQWQEDIGEDQEMSDPQMNNEQIPDQQFPDRQYQNRQIDRQFPDQPYQNNQTKTAQNMYQDNTVSQSHTFSQTKFIPGNVNKQRYSTNFFGPEFSNASTDNSNHQLQYEDVSSSNFAMEMSDSPTHALPDSSSDVASVEYTEISQWCNISYFEHDKRVGDRCKAKSNPFTINGFTDPCLKGDKLSLGSLSSVNRNSSIENVRKHIGRGVELHYSSGNVFAKCLGDQSIFVQSEILNKMSQYPPQTICKIAPKGSLKIFDTFEFAQLLASTVHLGYEAVYRLTDVCRVIISFIKGWGVDYHRVRVTACPCWIEVHLNGPLQWLDKVLKEMEPPSRKITSFS